MSGQLIHKNSSVEDRRPTAAQLVNGELSLNYNEAGPFLCCKDTAGNIQQLGGVKFDPDVPAGAVAGTWWLNTATKTLFVYDGSAWQMVGGASGGGSGGTINQILGDDGINAYVAGTVVTLNLDIDSNTGLHFDRDRLAIKTGANISFDADGKIQADIGSLSYKGTVDITADPIFTGGAAGDAYANIVAGAMSAPWLAATGLSATTVSVGDLVVKTPTGWSYVPTGGVTVQTDLGVANVSDQTLDVTSSTGANATLHAATTSQAGLMTAADKAILVIPGIDYEEHHVDRFGGHVDKEWTKGILTKAEGIVGYRYVIDTRLVDPTNADYQVKINGNATVTLDWGDGNVETKAETGTWGETHTYSAPGEYIVTLTLSELDKFIRPVASSPGDAGSHLIKSITGMSSELNQTLTTYANSWQNNKNLISVGPIAYGPSLNSLMFAFLGCTNLESFPFEDVPWSQLTNLSNTWGNCGAISNIPQGPLDLSNVITLSATWQRNSAMSGPWPAMITTSALTTINSAWRDNAGITGEFPFFDTSGVTSANNTWANTSISGAFPALDLGECLDVSSIVSRTKITSWPSIDMPKCKSFTSAWYNCTELTSWGLSDTSSAENMASAWAGCSKLTAMPAGITFPAATTFNSAWNKCTLLAGFPANAFDTTGTLVSNAFQNTFLSCALTAASIENILVSLDTNGQSNLALNLSGGTNAAKATWTAAATTAYDNLVNNKGWTINHN